MEPIGACFSEEWESSLSGFFPSVEADHFIGHLYGANNNEYGNTFYNNGIAPSNFLSIDETNVNINDTEAANFYNFTNTFHTNFHHFSEENSNSSGSNSPFFPTHSYENNQFFCESDRMLLSNHDNIHESTNMSSDGFLAPFFPHHVMEEVLFMKTEMVNEKFENDQFRQATNVADLGEELNLKRKINMQEHEASGDEKMNELIESPKKKPRLPRDAQKGKRNAMSKKGKKTSKNDNNEEKNGRKDEQNSSSSEDDNSNIASQDFKGKANAALNSSGKTRACRGAATDPQSLYARRRRERINERLRILQNLVPNGTKVDISTMLEEAVQYVKFLQLQIKLLSSDELWMFAPIAYNGMDMGLYNKLSI